MLISSVHRERKSTLRLSCHDYSSAGFYFVTICTRDREHFLGEIIKGEMILSDIGHIIADRWHALPDYFPDIQLDEFIVMPNHIHGILIKSYLASEEINSRKSSLLPTVIGSYKSGCTKVINAMQYKIFFGWQRGYHDHIIRNEAALYKIREYIKFNPLKWDLDENNVKRIQ